MAIINLIVRDVLPVVPFMACQDIRYYLNGIHVEPVETGGCVITATDGHTLAAMFSAKSYAEQPAILQWSAAMTTHAKKANRGKVDPRIVLESQDARLTLLAGKEELFIQAGKAWVEGKYPEWRAAVPAEVDIGLPGTYQAQYLNKVLAAGESIGARNGIQFFHGKNGKDGTLLARFTSHPDLLCLVMPMRGMHDESVPTWARKALAPPVPATAAVEEPAAAAA